MIGKNTKQITLESSDFINKQTITTIGKLYSKKIILRRTQQELVGEHEFQGVEIRSRARISGGCNS